MSLNVIITGSSGMVGKGVLLECVKHPAVTRILLINRTPTDIKSNKIEEILVPNFDELATLTVDFKSFNACFYCMGVSSVGLSEEQYTRLTFMYASSLASQIYNQNKNIIFCYVSGTGTDSSEKGRFMWARVKGKTENMVLNKGFKDAYMFRPGFIQPLNQIKSKTNWYNQMYKLTGNMYPVLNKIFPKYLTTTTNMGLAMINACLFGCDKKHLENNDINILANKG